MKEIILNFLTTQEGIALTSLVVGWLITSPIDLLRKLAKKTETTVDDKIVDALPVNKIKEQTNEMIKQEIAARKKKT